MSMRPCNKCFEVIWKYELLPDGWIRAVCQMCGHEVEWLSEKRLSRQKRGEREYKEKTFDEVVERGPLWTHDGHGRVFADGVEMQLVSSRKKGVGYKRVFVTSQVQNTNREYLRKITWSQLTNSPNHSRNMEDSK